MRPSRGMGSVRPSKMGKGRQSTRKGSPSDVTMYAKGGKTSNWIQGAIKKPGALRAALGAKSGEPIPAGNLAKAAKAPGKLGQRARFAMTLKNMGRK